MKKKRKPAPQLQAWIDARKRHRLSHKHVQMARELGLNPQKLGKLDNHKQEPWKAPLPEFIERLYLRNFGKEEPDRVLSIEERLRLDEEKKARKRERKRLKREAPAAADPPEQEPTDPDDLDLLKPPEMFRM